MCPRSCRRASSASVAHTRGELCAGKKASEGKSQSRGEHWVMALSARTTRGQKADCQETRLGEGGVDVDWDVEAG